MAVALRFQRIGKPKKAFFRMVAIDSRKKRNGKPLEVLGHYDPLKIDEKMSVNEQRIQYWILQGARVSDTLKNLLKNQNIWSKVNNQKLIEISK